MTTPVDPVTAARAVFQNIPVVRSVEYPLLKKLGKANIRRFLRDRDTYVREIKERKDQEGQTIGKPVSLTFSIEASLIESLVDLSSLEVQLTQLRRLRMYMCKHDWTNTVR
jgi:hypothetical protein